jgi:HEAT repeat protein
VSQVFISYAREDGTDFKNSVIRELEKNDFSHWVDTDAIGLGDDWTRKIDEALCSSFALILIITPAALKSAYVTYEWIYALGRGIKVIPLLFSEVNEVDKHPKLKNMNHEVFINPRMRPWKDVIDQLIKARAEYDPSNTLHRLSPNIPRFVQNALQDVENTNEHVRRHAIDNLAQSKDGAALEAIAGLVNHHLPDVCVCAAFTLAEKTNYQDKRAIPGLLEGLRLRDDERVKAARELKKYGEAAIEGLLEALHDPFSENRYIAAKTLGELKEKSAIPALLSLLDDQHTKVVHAALDALDSIGDTSIILALKDRLPKSDEHIQLRIAAILVRFGDYSVQTVLLQLLSREINYIGRPAANLLLRIPVDIQGVIETLENSPSMFGRSLAAEILGELKSPVSVPHLINALADEEAYVRGQAAIALGQMKVVEAVSRIAPLLEDPDFNAHHGAELALEMIGTPETIEILNNHRLNTRN